MASPEITGLEVSATFTLERLSSFVSMRGTLNMSEVAIQEWSNGKVVREKFVY
jgi:hypothetical protein